MKTLKPNAIETVFRDLKARDSRAFIPYLTAGDPSLEATAEILGFFAENGADVIELGVPFSDPMADGPVIQQAMERALRNGTTVRKVLALVKEFRKKHDTPVILMGYYNPFFAYGIAKFARDSGKAGVNGVLTVDLPPEEAGEFSAHLAEAGILPVMLATPVTDSRRIPIIKKAAKGFIYFVSVTGTTGVRNSLASGIDAKILRIKRETGLPVALGFGIAGPEMILRYRTVADAFIVGSAIVKRLRNWSSSGSKNRELLDFFNRLAVACHIGK